MTVARKDTLQTRRQLIDAAEHLFAGRGIDNISLVDISRAAQQKNRNALQYHFGDKVGLINAVLDKHGEGIALARQQLLDALEAKHSYSLKDAVDALVTPIADKLGDPDGGISFLKINSQLMANDHYAGIRLNRANTIPEARRLEKLIGSKMPVVDKPVLNARMLLVDSMLFNGLASYASRSAGKNRRIFVNTLIDSITAVLSQE
jgi:AcrR family transcriptional regulator